MNIHEYQAKALMKDFGVRVGEGLPAFSADEAYQKARELKGSSWVIKAQIHAGGRGKAGGVKIAKNLDEVKTIAQNMIGMTLITPQTGRKGKLVRRIYIERPALIDREFYLSLVIDRNHGLPSFIISPQGGMNIEEVAKSSPEKILSFPIIPTLGLRPFHVHRVMGMLGLDKSLTPKCRDLLRNLYNLFTRKDLSLLEVNPLVLTKDGELLCLDAKISIDDNALFRHKDLAQLRDWDEEDPTERKAGQYDLNFIKLEGEIGCMVNGAGLAMATMDIIQQHGSKPANFLDVGGGASKEKVTEAFKIILADDSVKAILVNIFGGIMRCDIIAEGIIEAARKMKISVPLVVRLEGTNVKEGKALLASSGLEIESADDLDQAAKKIVELAK